MEGGIILPKYECENITNFGYDRISVYGNYGGVGLARPLDKAKHRYKGWDGTKVLVTDGKNKGE